MPTRHYATGLVLLAALLSHATKIPDISTRNVTTSAKNIVELAVATPDLSTLVTALKAADLVDTLSAPGPFTVFAPTNEAFNALPPGVLSNLLKPENKAQLVDLLTYHVISGDVQTKNLWDGEMLKTVEGEYVTFRVSSDHDIFVNSAKVITADVGASNGVVHIIDAVLMPAGPPPAPPTPAPANKTIVDLALETKDLSTLVTALKAADLVDTLSAPGPFTVFAPTNEAFNALPPGVLSNLLKPENKAQLVDILTYHVVPGAVLAKNLLDGERIKTVEGKYVMVNVSNGDVFINNAEVTTADLTASNGVVHIIDAVLLPEPLPPVPPTPAPLMDIVQLAQSVPDLSVLVKALVAGNLTTTLSGTGPFTVFAPSNEAFAKLPAATLAHLLDPKNIEELVGVLTYHVVAGTATYSRDLSKGGPPKPLLTVEGDPVELQLVCGDRKCKRSGLRINPLPNGRFVAVVKSPDNTASNGVVHIIDAVLIPPANHLYFRGVRESFTGIRCGEVNAAPRMPPSLFDPNNADALRAYEEITCRLYSYGGVGKLEVGRCKDIGYDKELYLVSKVKWDPSSLMDPICAEKCQCAYGSADNSTLPDALPECKDEPDDPKAGEWCSLCGPTYNQPIIVNLLTKQ